MKYRWFAVLLTLTVIISMGACKKDRGPLGTEKNPVKLWFMPLKEEAVYQKHAPAIEKFLEEKTGYQVHTAESGETGIEKVRDTKYDLIFLDLKMPGLDGVEVMRELQKIDQDVPIYIVTAFFDEFLARLRKAAQDGLSFEVLKKPLKGAQIRSIVNGILEGAMPVKQ